VDKKSLNDIFQRYLNNECSTYEIKYLLKHFISGNNDAVLKEMIADKLKENSVDEHLQYQNPTLLLDETFKNSIQKTDSKTVIVADTAKIPPFFQRSMFKLIAILMLAVLLCEFIYTYYNKS
jgi:ABC-type uncharacterized transport system permease subunit